ncbi:aldose 1-epimerase family protein [Pedobacter heparinus]|uniref:Aldose 1-epimerase n=1 Tax=Pedobacter heparinus (strain ATCC 13125 / DSM 2366 / CIP 104194 / JCM 7457 / NBRC 12017 / NCIMB 9290 / NRRL B-14731 / HIM 762-3) TaxID=485917 RepID=C6Y042_PEDHD|nr:aldose 1-epimerase family protein [Pedobacter heparinus]ACU04754.1 Aldose 1-epimerase [Pedobacter heparinus DSM 2366]
MIFLENEQICTSIASKGAELQSLKSKKNNVNYLWNGNPEYWGKFSPVLFPIVGGLKNNTYYFEGKEYQLPRHGFARDKDFQVKQLSATEALLTLSDDEESLKVYPFRFVLQLRYQLSDRAISCTYEVLNPDNEKSMLFSIGGHPAFATSTEGGLKYTDYFLQFNKDTELVYHKVKHDLIDSETAVIELKEGKLPLNHALFYDDALVLKTLKSDCITLHNHKNKNGIHFRFKNFPFFGIWAAKNADFVCLEPWCGLADGTAHDQHIEHKEGIVTLGPNETFVRKWEVECF